MRMLLLVLLLALPARAANVADLDWTQRPGAPLPYAAPLVDADGGATTLGQVAAGRPLILAPGYFQCPNLCGVVRDDLFAALAAMPGEADYAIALLTIDPAETPADAARSRAGVADRYPELAVHTLTGPAASLAAIADAAGFHARFDPANKQFLHPAGVVVATPDGRVSTTILGVGYAPGALAAAIEQARHGATLFAEPIHLFCFSYDPATGRASVAAMDAVRAAGLLTVLALGTVLVRTVRRA